MNALRKITNRMGLKSIQRSNKLKMFLDTTLCIEEKKFTGDFPIGMAE